jgi:hypothetical protein
MCKSLWIPFAAMAVLTMAVVPQGAYAVDGIVLIDQNRALAGNVTPGDAPGFPISITQPGSYKLSGNLTMSTAAQGNFNGLFDTAIAISSSNVTLDLNGFSITVNDLLGVTLGHPFYAIADTAAFSQISILNGSVRMTTNTNLISLNAISLRNCLVAKFEDLNLVGKQPVINTLPGPTPDLLITGANSLVHHVVTNGFILLTCPSTATDNIASVSVLGGVGCIIINNSTFLVVGVP